MTVSSLSVKTWSAYISKVLHINREEHTLTMSSSILFAFLALAVVSMIHPATSDEYSDVLREHAVTEPVRHYLEYKWSIKNFTLLPYKFGLCLRSPDFHTHDPNSRWVMKFCLYPGKHATVSAALQIQGGSSNDYVNQNIDGHITVIKSGVQKAYQVFDGAAVSLDSKVRISEYVEDSVDLLSYSTPLDDLLIITRISMPTKVITTLVESLDDYRDLESINNEHQNINGPQNVDGPIGYNGPENFNGPPSYNGHRNFIGPLNIYEPQVFNPFPNPNELSYYEPLNPPASPNLNQPPGPNGPPNSNIGQRLDGSENNNVLPEINESSVPSVPESSSPPTSEAPQSE